MAQIHLRWSSAVVLLAASLACVGQTAGGKAPAYDVVSIKQNKSNDNGTRVWIEGPTYTATNIPFKRLLESSYDIKADLIFGVTEPLASANFDITAKMLDTDPAEIKKLNDKQKQQLLLPVVVERFKLKTHKETRTLPVYELVVAPGGSKLKPVPGSDGDGTIHMNGRELQLLSMSTSRLASALADIVHRKVVDKTGLTGGYDLDLKWTPEGADQGQGDAPDIFTAVQEQLGLKLQPAKAPVEVLVMDSAEMPSEN